VHFHREFIAARVFSDAPAMSSPRPAASLFQVSPNQIAPCACSVLCVDFNRTIMAMNFLQS
jgi:hypothetical protein